MILQDLPTSFRKTKSEAPPSGGQSFREFVTEALQDKNCRVAPGSMRPVAPTRLDAAVFGHCAGSRKENRTPSRPRSILFHASVLAVVEVPEGIGCRFSTPNALSAFVERVEAVGSTHGF